MAVNRTAITNNNSSKTINFFVESEDLPDEDI
jgi:hypothetical protein